MAEQDISKLTLSFEAKIKESDISKTNQLYAALENLEKIEPNNRLAPYLANISKAMQGFKGISIQSNLGKGIDTISNAINKLDAVKDITGTANNLEKGFEILSRATKYFEGNNAKISSGLGKGVTGIVGAINTIDGVQDISSHARKIDDAFYILSQATKYFEDNKTKINSGLGKSITSIVGAVNSVDGVNDISQHANNIDNGFRILASATKHFDGNTARIANNMGTSVLGVVNALNGIESVRDVTPYADNIKNGFNVLSQATKSFEGNNAKIGVNVGRSITNLIEATNKISEVKDISDVSSVIKSNFASIAEATRSFDGIGGGSDYSGIARLVTSLTSISKVKPINQTVVNNAQILAKAINVLDKDVTASTPRLEAMSKVTKGLGLSFNQASKDVGKFNNSMGLVNFAITLRGIRSVSNSLVNLTDRMYSTVDSFGQVQNTLSFFTRSLGSEAEKTAAIIQQYANMGAIDFTEFSDQTAKLNQMYKNYGISTENSAKMALNMTQLAYDLSYALGENGKDIALWNQRMTSISTGNVRAGYWAGLDLSVKALAEDFEGLTSKTEKGIKIQAAYNAILEQTKDIQGQLPREFQNSYVQMQVFQNRINQLKQSIGRALVPAFQAVIQWGLVTLKVIERVINALVILFGGEGFQLINYEDMIKEMGTETGGFGDAVDDVASGFEDATKNAKELKKTISGIDQVFTINDELPKAPKDKGDGSVAGIGGPVGGYDWLSELASADNIAALKKIETSADKIVQDIKDVVPFIIAAGVGLASWKIAKSFMDSLMWISKTKNIFGGLGLDKLAFGVGFPLFLANLNELRLAVSNIMEKGASFDTVSYLISSFVGTVGSAFTMMGNFKLGGIMFLIQGLIDIARGLKTMVDDGPNYENVTTTIKGLSSVVIAIGLLKGNWQAVGTGMIMQGSLAMIKEIIDNWEMIKKGDWSGVDKVTFFTGALTALGGVATALGLFKKTIDTANSGKSLSKAAESTKELSDATGGVSKNLQSMAKNLGLGIVIMAEIAVIGIIFIGAIWAIGEMLQKVGDAWGPVISDGPTIATAMVVGTGILATVGTAAYLLGEASVKGGGTIPLALGVGTAMLVLLGIAAIAFTLEIAILGKSLQEIGTAWQPVLNDGSNIAASIALGTTLLVAIGVAAFALGSATVASAGTIPLAIGAGTAMLLLLGGATILFVKELTVVANQITTQLSPALAGLNEVMPTLSTNMGNFTFFMIEFAGHVVAYTASSAVAGLSGTIDTIVGWFTKDPIKKMADDANKNKKSFDALIKALETVNPLVKKGNDLMITYMDLLVALKTSADKAKDMGTMPSVGTDFKNFSASLKTGFNDLDGIKTRNVASIMNALSSIDLNRFRGLGTSIVKEMELGINNYNYSFTTAINKMKSALTFSATYIGSNIARDIVSGINSSSYSVVGFQNSLKSNLTFSATSIGTGIASGITGGINNSSAWVSSFTNSLRNNLSFSGWSIGYDIASGLVSGINSFYPNVSVFTNRLKQNMKVSFEVRSPSRWAKRVIGAMLGKGVETGINESDVNLSPFKNNIESGLDGISNEVRITPHIEMPVVDTSVLRGNVEAMSTDLNSKVSGYFNYDSDGAEKAIERMSDRVSGKLDEIKQVTEDGKVIEIDGREIGKTSEKHINNDTVRSNKIFG